MIMQTKEEKEYSHGYYLEHKTEINKTYRQPLCAKENLQKGAKIIGA